MKKYTIVLLTTILIIISFFIQSCKGQTKASTDRQELTAEQLKSSMLNKANKLNSIHKEYQKNIEIIGYSKVLDLQRIKNDVGFKQTNRIIQKTDSLQKDFNFNNNKLLTEWQHLINKVPSSLLEKRKKDNILKKIQQKINTINNNYTADTTALTTIKKIVSILKSEKCKYKIVKSNILFYDKTCLYNYQKLREKLRSAVLSAKINEIKNKTNR